MTPARGSATTSSKDPGGKQILLLDPSGNLVEPSSHRPGPVDRGPRGRERPGQRRRWEVLPELLALGDRVGAGPGPARGALPGPSGRRGPARVRAGRRGGQRHRRVRHGPTVFAAVAAVPGVVGVNSPYDDPSGSQVSKDGTVAYATILFDRTDEKVTERTVHESSRPGVPRTPAGRRTRSAAGSSRTRRRSVPPRPSVSRRRSSSCSSPSAR